MLSCDYCEYQTPTKALLSRHINSKHSEHKNTTKTCSYCNKVFSSVKACQNHVKKEICRKVDEVFGPFQQQTHIIEKPTIHHEKIIEESIKNSCPYSWVKSSFKTVASIVFVTLAFKFIFKKRK